MRGRVRGAGPMLSCEAGAELRGRCQTAGPVPNCGAGAGLRGRVPRVRAAAAPGAVPGADRGPRLPARPRRSPPRQGRRVPTRSRATSIARSPHPWRTPGAPPGPPSPGTPARPHSPGGRSAPPPRARAGSGRAAPRARVGARAGLGLRGHGSSALRLHPRGTILCPAPASVPAPFPAEGRELWAGGRGSCLGAPQGSRPARPRLSLPSVPPGAGEAVPCTGVCHRRSLAGIVPRSLARLLSRPSHAPRGHRRTLSLLRKAVGSSGQLGDLPRHPVSHTLSLCTDNLWSDQSLETDPDLPPGWRKICDSLGTYYWHVPTGTTQWQHPARTSSPGGPTEADGDETLQGKVGMRAGV